MTPTTERTPMFSTRQRAISLLVAVALAVTGSLLAASPAGAASVGRLPVGKVFTTVGSTVQVLAADGTTARTILLPHHGSLPLVSPNGSWIAYQTKTGLRMISIFGDGDRLLVGRAYARPLAWSPDSHRLVFTALYPIVTVVNVTTGALHPVLPAADPQAQGAQWSPDGWHILLTGWQTWQLVRTDTWRQRSFVKSPCPYPILPAWSPDGHELAVACFGVDTIEVALVNLGTGRTRFGHDIHSDIAGWVSNSVLLTARLDTSTDRDQIIAVDRIGRPLWAVRVTGQFDGIQALR